MKLWLLGTTFLVLAAAAYLVTRWWRYGGGRQQLLSLPLQSWPDFSKWDQRAEFRLDEAAALWFDAEPRSPMWWRARWNRRRLRVALADRVAASQLQPLTAPTELGPQPIASRDMSPIVHRDTLRALAEKQGVCPLFLYPEFRFRWRDRDRDTDKARLASIHESVRFAVASAERELDGLWARLEYARESAAALLMNTDSQKDQDHADKINRAGIEVRLLAPERRTEELKDHLAVLRRIESAVNKELNS
jgi:hypothetical protein